MARKISIEIVAQDNFTKTLKNMRSDTQKFNKDLEALNNQLKNISRKELTVKTNTKDARNDMAKLVADIDAVKKAMDKVGDSEATRGVEGIAANTQKASKGYKDLKKSISDSASEMKKQAGKQFLQLTLDTGIKAATTYSTSAFGAEGGTLASNTLSMAATGAMMGSVVPVIGTAVGAALGAGLGYINGMLENYAKRDDAYKDYVSKQFSGIMEERSTRTANASALAAGKENPEDPSSFTYKKNELAGLQESKSSAMGVAYNQARVEGEGGLQDQIESNAKYSTQLEDVNAKMGEYQAYLENTKDNYKLATQTALFGTDEEFKQETAGLTKEEQDTLADYRNEYQAANADYNKATNEEEQMRAIAKMQEIMDASGSFASNAYAGSEAAQIDQESNEALIQTLQESAVTSKEGWKSVYEISNQLTKGQSSVWTKLGFFQDPEKQAAGYGPKAYGLNYVPYNNFPAMLHEGERVLTASENRGYGKGGGVSVTGNNFTVREEADIGKIARALFREIEKTRMVMAY